MKKNTLAFIGFVLVAVPFIGGSVKYLSDWSTAELLGYNFFTLLCFFVGGVLLYKSFKKKDSVVDKK